MPKDSEQRIVLDIEKAKDWIAKGAQPTDRVSRFLEAAGAIEKKVRSNPNKAVPGTKAKEREEEKRQKAEDAAAAAAAPAEEAAPAEAASEEAAAE